ncbi:expressed protein, partial [Phakopsora pachyrhizi]
PSDSCDPAPDEFFVSQETLKTYYKPLYKNKVRVFSRKGKVIKNHMIAKFISFDQMKEESKIGWQKLVAFLLHRQNFVTEVSKDNAALISGKMYAEGWRKAMVAEEIVGCYVNQAKLLRQMKEMNFNFEDEAEGFEFIGCFLSEQFRNVAPGSHQSCKEYLQQRSIPSITQVNHTSNTTYFPDDFCSAITYTMDDYSNKAHRDRDTDNWTLIGFIPIKKGGLIAEDGFDVEGGEFVIRDLKVFIDFSKVNGVVLVILKTSKCVHQTISSRSKSGFYTRFGFSCQISRKMSHSIEKYMNGEYEGNNYTFGTYDLYANKAKEIIKTKKKISKK